jgi:hypothetical protein
VIHTQIIQFYVSSVPTARDQIQRQWNQSEYERGRDPWFLAFVRLFCENWAHHDDDDRNPHEKESKEASIHIMLYLHYLS